MPPTLLLIRHAQAEHNVTSDWSIRDAPLTELGKHQCLELQESLKQNDLAQKVELVVVSAQRRTLQTATIGLDFLIKRGIPGETEAQTLRNILLHKKFMSWYIRMINITMPKASPYTDEHFSAQHTVHTDIEPVIPSALWQENADKPCDTGSPLDVISAEFPQYDFSGVDPSFPDKTTNLAQNPYAFTGRAILARGQTALKELYSRSEKVIAVVSHSGFLRTAVSNRMFFNADWRIFTFDEAEMQRSGRFVLREDESTEKKGGGMGRSQVGVFGVVDGDFPPEVEGEEEAKKAKEESKVDELGEASREKPSS